MLARSRNDVETNTALMHICGAAVLRAESLQLAAGLVTGAALLAFSVAERALRGRLLANGVLHALAGMQASARAITLQTRAMRLEPAALAALLAAPTNLRDGGRHARMIHFMVRTFNPRL